MLKDLAESNLNQLLLLLKRIKEEKEKTNRKNEKTDIISFLTFFNYVIENNIKKNEEFFLLFYDKKYKKKIKYLNNLLKYKEISLKILLEKEKELKIKDEKVIFILKNSKKEKILLFLKKIETKIKERIKEYIILLEKIKFLFDSLHSIKFNKIVIHKRILEKLKNKKIMEIVIDILFENLENYKIINNLFIQIEKENYVFLVRKDSLYIPMIVIEEILNKQNQKDREILDFYWQNWIIPYKEENKELEKIYWKEKELMDNIEMFDFYIYIEKEFLILKYFSMQKIKEIV